MFVGLFLAGAATGIVGTLGGKKIVKLFQENREKDKELKDLRNEIRDLKQEVRDSYHNN